ncbi:MAG: hypothetical protein ABIA04_13905 [Pseudomonadota bacterium]
MCFKLKPNKINCLRCKFLFIILIILILSLNTLFANTRKPYKGILGPNYECTQEAKKKGIYKLDKNNNVDVDWYYIFSDAKPLKNIDNERYENCRESMFQYLLKESEKIHKNRKQYCLKNSSNSLNDAQIMNVADGLDIDAEMAPDVIVEINAYLEDNKLKIWRALEGQKQYKTLLDPPPIAATLAIDDMQIEYDLAYKLSDGKIKIIKGGRNVAELTVLKLNGKLVAAEKESYYYKSCHYVEDGLRYLDEKLSNFDKSLEQACMEEYKGEMLSFEEAAYRREIDSILDSDFERISKEFAKLDFSNINHLNKVEAKYLEALENAYSGNDNNQFASKGFRNCISTSDSKDKLALCFDGAKLVLNDEDGKKKIIALCNVESNVNNDICFSSFYSSFKSDPVVMTTIISEIFTDDLTSEAELSKKAKQASVYKQISKLNRPHLKRFLTAIKENDSAAIEAWENYLLIYKKRGQFGSSDLDVYGEKRAEQYIDLFYADIRVIDPENYPPRRYDDLINVLMQEEVLLNMEGRRILVEYNVTARSLLKIATMDNYLIKISTNKKEALLEESRLYKKSFKNKLLKIMSYENFEDEKVLDEEELDDVQDDLEIENEDVLERLEGNESVWDGLEGQEVPGDVDDEVEQVIQEVMNVEPQEPEEVLEVLEPQEGEIKEVLEDEDDFELTPEPELELGEENQDEQNAEEGDDNEEEAGASVQYRPSGIDKSLMNFLKRYCPLSSQMAAEYKVESLTDLFVQQTGFSKSTINKHYGSVLGKKGNYDYWLQQNSVLFDNQVYRVSNMNWAQQEYVSNGVQNLRQEGLFTVVVKAGQKPSFIANITAFSQREDNNVDTFRVEFHCGRYSGR